MTELRFHIKFDMFDETKPLAMKQNKIIEKMTSSKIIDNDLKKILKYAINELDNYKFLDRLEPAISSIDEKKQLRCSTNLGAVKKHYLIFSQRGESIIPIEELKIIGKKIQNEIEEYLHYSVYTTLFIDIDKI